MGICTICSRHFNNNKNLEYHFWCTGDGCPAQKATSYQEEFVKDPLDAERVKEIGNEKAVKFVFKAAPQKKETFDSNKLISMQGRLTESSLPNESNTVKKTVCVIKLGVIKGGLEQPLLAKQPESLKCCICSIF